MKSPLLPALCCLLLAATLCGQDRLPTEETVRYAKLCTDQIGVLNDAPIRLEVAADNACAVRGEGGGAMAIPDARLTADTIAKPGKDVVPVAQVWLRKWTLVVDGKGLPRDKLRVVTVNIDDKARPMPLLLVGLQQKGDAVELVAYGQGNEPLLRVPAQKVEFVAQSPVELDWARGENNVDKLTVSIEGRYQAVLPITRESN
ncbi:MAG TPA: hypothetical protein VHB77_00620 [Planctomycetaceae bacterium]|nr:hypothetical protein [Planctomycetaceae bacterium]